MVQLEHVHPGGPSREPDAIAVKAVGCLRAYTTTKNRPPRRGLFQRLFGLPSSFALVQAAKEAGFPQAMVIPVSYGFARGGPIDSNHIELGYTHLPICVEIVGDVDQLEDFCRAHPELFANCTVMLLPGREWQISSSPLSED